MNANTEKPKPSSGTAISMFSERMVCILRDANQPLTHSDFVKRIVARHGYSRLDAKKFIETALQEKWILLIKGKYWVRPEPTPEATISAGIVSILRDANRPLSHGDFIKRVRAQYQCSCLVAKRHIQAAQQRKWISLTKKKYAISDEVQPWYMHNAERDEEKARCDERYWERADKSQELSETHKRRLRAHWKKIMEKSNGIIQVQLKDGRNVSVDVAEFSLKYDSNEPLYWLEDIASYHKMLKDNTDLADMQSKHHEDWTSGSEESLQRLMNSRDWRKVTRMFRKRQEHNTSPVSRPDNRMVKAALDLAAIENAPFMPNGNSVRLKNRGDLRRFLKARQILHVPDEQLHDALLRSPDTKGMVEVVEATVEDNSTGESWKDHEVALLRTWREMNLDNKAILSRVRKELKRYITLRQLQNIMKKIPGLKRGPGRPSAKIKPNPSSS